MSAGTDDAAGVHAGGMAGMGVDEGLEDLPAYEAVGSPHQAVQPQEVQIAAPTPVRAGRSNDLIDLHDETPPAFDTPPSDNVHEREDDTQEQAPPAAPAHSQPAQTPDEPPPGYEEAQADGISSQLEHGLRFRHGRGEGSEEAETLEANPWR